MAYDPHRHGRRSIRLKGWDYRSPGLYFVTICVKGGDCVFGQVVDGVMVLSDFGRIVQEEWLRTGELRSDYVVLDAFVVMPNHFHAIVWILDNGDLAEDGGDSAETRSRVKPHSLAAIVRGFKSACTKRINTIRDASGNPFWQRNYYEHIIRNETSLNRIRTYIQSNPARWADDDLHPQAPNNKFNKPWRNK